MASTNDDVSSPGALWQAALGHMQKAQEIIDIVAPASVLGARCHELIESAREIYAAQANEC